jgi:phosphate transport system substrate-binding protein
VLVLVINDALCVIIPRKKIRTGGDLMNNKRKLHAGIRTGLLTSLVALGLAAGVSAEQAGSAVKPAVDSAIGSYAASAAVSGGIAIAGSDTMQPIITKIASAFRKWQPEVKIAIQGGGTDAALLQFLQNQAAIRRGDADAGPKSHMVSGSLALLAASRPLTEHERSDFRSRYGYEVTEIPIALDAIAVFVNHRNPVEGLALEQLDAIFSKDRKRGAQEEVTTWGQLGLKDEWAQQPIHRYGQDHRSGTRAIFIQEALKGGEFRPDVREESGPATEILAISRDILGIGYAGVGFRASTIRFLPLAERAGAAFVAPSPETVAGGTYPLGRQLYLYAKKSPKGGLEPEVLEFLKFINSREGQDMVAKAGAYPLPAHQVAKNLQILIGAAMSATASDSALLADGK